MPASCGLAPLDGRITARAVRSAAHGLDPRVAAANPVMFVVEAAAVVATVLFLRGLLVPGDPPAWLAGQLAGWLWLTVFLAGLAEAVAEARGQASATRLREFQDEIRAKLLVVPDDPAMDWLHEVVLSGSLRPGAVVMVETGDVVPADGEVIAGVAEVDESVITGESARVIRESGGDRAAVLGGSRVVSDWLKIRVTARKGESCYDHVIRLIESARRRGVAQRAVLSGPFLALAALVAIMLALLTPTEPVLPSVLLLVALLAALMPTTVAALLAAVGIAGMGRLAARNLIAKSGSAVDAAGRIDTVLLDKTGTLTLGDRRAAAFLPLPEVEERELAAAAALASHGDATAEGRSVLELAEARFGIVPDRAHILEIIPFHAQTRMSGAWTTGGEVRKGAADAILQHLGITAPPALEQLVERVARAGGTPLLVASGRRILGVVQLKDVLRPGLRERVGMLRAMGVRTVLITGDHPLTAAAVAAQVGVDDHRAHATPDAKLQLIRKEQARGKLVAMYGDGTNDAPALAQADVGMALGSGSAAAREAANVIDLDSDPLQLVQLIRASRQLAATRAAVTWFSAAGDLGKYLAVVPAILAALHPSLRSWNILGLASPQSAVLAAVVLNPILILVLIPVAIHGLRDRLLAHGQAAALCYGLAGLLAALAGMALIERLLVGAGLV